MESEDKRAAKEGKARIPEVALTCSLVEGDAILQNLRHLQTEMNLELQTLRDQRASEHVQFQELMAWIRNEVIRLQAQREVFNRLMATVEGVIEPKQTGESGNGTQEDRQGRRKAQGADTQTCGNAPH